MAILKISNNTTTTQTALKAVTKYVLNENKTNSELIAGIGDFSYSDTDLDTKTVFSEFMRVKELFGKVDGRQYMHAIQSFEPGESNPKQVHTIGKALALQLWPNQQVLIVTHTDKKHLHNHFIVNTVSYTDGRKLHWNKRDLSHAKSVNDSLCCEHKLSIPRKKLSTDDTVNYGVWNKKLFNLIKMATIGERQSFVLDCSNAVFNAIRKARSKDEFILLMSEHGWSTTWDDSRKYITFIDSDNHKIRNSKLSKITNIDLSKESLIERIQKNENQYKQSKQKCRKRRM